MKKILILTFIMIIFRAGYSEEGISSYHIVKRGDTLTSIAAEYGVDIEDIKLINNLEGERVKAGEKLYLDFGGYKERWVEVETENTRKISSGTRQVRGREILMSERRSVDWVPDFIWPIEWHGTTSEWGYRIDPVTGDLGVKHSGIDLKAKMRTPVYAPADGVVRIAGWWNGYGRLIILDHTSGYSTRFGHLDEYLVEEGNIVKKGELIGRTGNSGRSTGPHLHYEIRRDELSLNPMTFKRNEIFARVSEEAKDEVAFGEGGE